MTEEKNEIEVKADTYIGSLYSQLASVTISDIDVTLEFIFINPREKKGQIVSRITMPLGAGEELAKTILSTAKMHNTRKKGEQNG